MKKFLGFLCAVTLVFGMAGSANAILFTDYKDLNVQLGGTGEDNSGRYTWTHNTPGAFEVPYDVVNDASLVVSASYVSWTNETIDVEGTIHGSLRDDTWTWDQTLQWNGSTEFDIEDVFVTWDTGDPLNVALNYTEVPGWNFLHLGHSTFTLDYDNGTAPVPEPSTILLVGTGLIGIIGFGRKRLNKKA